ncbi:MAG: glycosyltransferase family 39 protein, partial [Oscillospiraceae bacterium]|nr:glycosyltransferase family 39 protein [Oscillospiraceae bacterium]
FYVFAKQLWGENFALVSALFFAVYPWHIMKSRWGLESNLFPDLVLWGCVLLLLYIKKQKPFYLYGAVLLLNFALYCYGTAYMFMPFFVGGMWIYMLCKKKITAKHFVLSALLFFVTALPIIMFVVINITDLEQFSVLGFTIPKMYQQRFSTVTGTGENFFVGCIGNLKDFISILINQTDGLPWNGFAKYGVCYLVFVPLILVGIIISAVQKSEHSFIVHWWTVCALLVIMVSEVNVNRANIIFIPIAYYISLALYTIAKQHKYIKIAVVCVCICLFGLFCKNYFNQHTSVISYCFFHSYEEALDYADSFDSEKIYVSASINQPYMLTLFYTQTDPYTYLKTRQVSNAQTAFETIDSFDKYYFYLPAEISADEDAVYIVNRDDTTAFDPQYFETENFRYYTVVYGKK